MKVLELTGTALLTVKIELPRNFFKLWDTSEVRRQLLYVSSIESLAGFDKIKVVLFEFASFYRLLLPCVLLAKLYMPQSVSKRPPQCYTKPS